MWRATKRARGTGRSKRRASAPGAPTAAVLASPPVNAALPTISGTAERSIGITSTAGTWTGTGNTYTYQWQRSTDGTTWSSISGATSARTSVASMTERLR